MKLLSEDVKLDIGLTSANLNGPATGAYYLMTNYRKALFVVEVGAMAAASTCQLQIMQAKDSAGKDAKVITNNAAEITANVKVTEATLTAAHALPQCCRLF